MRLEGDLRYLHSQSFQRFTRGEISLSPRPVCSRAERIVKVAIAPRPSAPPARSGSILRPAISLEPVIRSLEDVHLRPALADLRAVDVAPTALDVAQQPVEAVAVVLGEVADETDSITDREQSLDRRRCLSAAAFLAEVDLWVSMPISRTSRSRPRRLTLIVSPSAMLVTVAVLRRSLSGEQVGIVHPDGPEAPQFVVAKAPLEDGEVDGGADGVFHQD